MGSKVKGAGEEPREMALHGGHSDRAASSLHRQE